MRHKKIFVTGCSGFVGQNLILRLIQDKYNITALSRSKKNISEKNLRYVKGDLLDSVSFEKAIANHDVIVHLASNVNVNYSILHPKEVMLGNVNMLLNVLEALRKNCEKPLIVFASTDRLYGKTKKRIVDENEAPCPIEPYTASKILCETILETYRNLYGIPYIIF